MPVFVYTTKHEYFMEIGDLIRAFYPKASVKRGDTEFTNISHGGATFTNIDHDAAAFVGADHGNTPVCSDMTFKCNIVLSESLSSINLDFYRGNDLKTYLKEVKLSPHTSKRERNRSIKNSLKLLVYEILVDISGRSLKWGALTGISPVKLAHELLAKGLERDGIIKNLQKDYGISLEKANLLVDIALVQGRFFKNNHSRKISVYINIPICPTKCLYCSFPSATMDKCRHLVDDYLSALEREMEAMALLCRGKNIEVETVYIGGGTPTSLKLKDLGRLLSMTKKLWQLEPLKEFTVEGGRPDTMPYEKLELLREYGVSRISINPQTMVDRTLKLIGRGHNTEEMFKCFMDARKIGFDHINMDVIVGLPGEGIEDAHTTMDGIKALGPDNLTVHTLAIKRASNLKGSLGDYSFIDEDLSSKMMDIFRDGALSMGMRPYYLYRQKYMLGNMENIGYTFPGKESIYNVQSMEDMQATWAFGAGGISKVPCHETGRIERAANVKNIEEYIDRIDEMIERKTKLVLNFDYSL